LIYLYGFLFGFPPFFGAISSRASFSALVFLISFRGTLLAVVSIFFSSSGGGLIYTCLRDEKYLIFKLSPSSLSDFLSSEPNDFDKIFFSWSGQCNTIHNNALFGGSGIS